MTSWIDTDATTRIITKTRRTRWTIETVSRLVSRTKLHGPDFYFTPSLSVGLAFERNYLLSDLFLGYVWVCNKSDIEIQIDRKLFLFDCEGQILYESTDGTIFTLEKGKYIDIAEIPRGSRKRVDAFPNDTLIIDLSIGLKDEITTEIRRFQSTVDPRKKLIEDFKLMQVNSVKYDVFLQIDNERIPAHWSILCSRSPYFRRMFDSNMKETVENCIAITDLSLSAIKKLVEFLYTADFVENDIEELFDLYYAADKYEVTDMRALCGSKFMSKATADNVCQIIQLAHRHNDKDLKLQAMDFIQFHTDAVYQTDGWKRCEGSESLAAEILSFCLRKNKLIY